MTKHETGDVRPESSKPTPAAQAPRIALTRGELRYIAALLRARGQSDACTKLETIAHPHSSPPQFGPGSLTTRLSEELRDAAILALRNDLRRRQDEDANNKDETTEQAVRFVARVSRLFCEAIGEQF